MPHRVNPQWLVDRFPNDIDAQVRYLTFIGFAVVSQDRGRVQLVKKKRFSCLFFLLFTFFYIGWFLAKRDFLIYIDISSQRPQSAQADSSFVNRLEQFLDFYLFPIVSIFGAIALVYLFWAFMFMRHVYPSLPKQAIYPVRATPR